MLSDSHSRGHYNEQLQAALIDEMDDYTGLAISKWLANTKMGKNWDPNEERAVFVVRSWLTSCWIITCFVLAISPRVIQQREIVFDCVLQSPFDQQVSSEAI